jgi:hypothetical protein
MPSHVDMYLLLGGPASAADVAEKRLDCVDRCRRLMTT